MQHLEVSGAVRYIQSVPGEMCQTSGECSLGSNYTDITQNTYVQS